MIDQPEVHLAKSTALGDVWEFRPEPSQKCFDGCIAGVTVMAGPGRTDLCLRCGSVTFTPRRMLEGR